MRPPLRPLQNVVIMAGLCAVLACDGGGGGGSGGGGGGGGGGGAPQAPLKASADNRRLVDGSGKPVLILGDHPGSITVQVSVADADEYFAARAAQGFNAAWVNVLNEAYTGGRFDASTYDGIVPFLAMLPGDDEYDLRFPNEAYFARVDAMVETAAAHGFHLWFDPAETGGFLSTLRANGVANAQEYGRFLGQRYRGADNIVWMSGNDFQLWTNPVNDEVVRAVAEGIREMDERHLHTTMLDSPVSSSLDNVAWYHLLGINSVYTYYPTYAQLYADWLRTPRLPSVMIEANYEGESLWDAPHTTGAVDCRNILWWSMLSGAAGSFYGSRWFWPMLPNWRDHLHDPGAESVKHVRALLEAKRWHKLEPDIEHDVATAGYGTWTDVGNAQNNDYVTTARVPDGSLVIAYFPVPHDLSIDMTKLAHAATVTWFDPSTGTSTVEGSSVPNVGTHVFTPPSTPHTDGSRDWVLVLEAK